MTTSREKPEARHQSLSAPSMPLAGAAGGLQSGSGTPKRRVIAMAWRVSRMMASMHTNSCHQPNTKEAEDEIIEAEGKYAWILLHEPRKLYIHVHTAQRPYMALRLNLPRSDFSIILSLCPLLHMLSPQELFISKSRRTAALE